VAANCAANYTCSTATGTLTVNKVALSVTITGETMVYGTAVPTPSSALTAGNYTTYVTVTGLVNGDTVPTTISIGLSTPATSSSSVGGGTGAGGAYLINSAVTGSSSASYTITNPTGLLTITKNVLTVTAKTQTITYGSSPNLTGSAATVASRVQASDTQSTVLGGTEPSLEAVDTTSTPVATTSPVGGTYTIIPTQGTLPPTLTNYTYSLVNGTLNITQATLTLTAIAQSIAYGNPPNLAATYGTTISVTGLQNGETTGVITATRTLSDSASPNHLTNGNPNVGTWTISVSVASACASNYTCTTATGNLTVTPVALSVAVNSASKNYGAALPTFSGVVTGLVNTDAVGGTITISYNTTATASSPVGSNYPITATVGGTNIGNYTLTNTPSTLTINPVGLTVTVASQTKVYGAALPSLAVDPAR